MPCRCGMVKIMRLDIPSQYAPKQKTFRMLCNEKSLTNRRILNLTQNQRNMIKK